MNRKFVKSCTGVLIFLMTFVSFLGNSSSYADYEMPEYIKIGLNFENSALDNVSLSFKNGMDIYEGETIVFESDESSLNAIKEDYYSKEGNEWVRKSEDEISSFSSIGPVSLVYDRGFSSYDEAKDFQDENLRDSYIYYNGQWFIKLGNYMNEEDANAQKINYSSFESDLYISKSSSKNIYILDDEDDIIFGYDSSLDLEFRDGDNEAVGLKNRSYRGSVLLKRIENSDITVINKVKFNEYLYGVLPAEMSKEWPIEALKAQAIAASSYAVKNIGSHKSFGFDLCSTTHCQVYKGYSVEGPVSNRAVDETMGMIMTFDGKIVTAFYHSNSGGVTENSENVWNGKVGYVRSVDDPFSIGYPNDNWSTIFTREEIKNLLVEAEMDIGDISNMEITERAKSGRVLKLKIYGNMGDITLSKDQIRKVFGYKALKSTLFDIEGNSFDIENSKFSILGKSETLKRDLSEVSILGADGEIKNTDLSEVLVVKGTEERVIDFTEVSKDQYLIRGKGYGHGLGMSQWGAKSMADKGYTFDQILKHYYTGINIERK